ncbi:hypothetical protein K461DRAFT_270255 [Myriangium duriaei CBS 260.36]|uniref:Uncharacterized protein n=1 Tax=Myriangium duriaei CBS 260.36 TaxID=1168546 RepID=A0A9P4MF66_9PEZI|nr:hypothetical protein K461DRAFT_270255 [Myriangium duriaei CBS 260.36]
MDAKCADPDLQLDVDIMMVDYLIHSALHAVLADPLKNGIKSERATDALCMVDDILIVFNAHHPSPPDLPTLDFRLKLLQFATLFCRRTTLDHFTPQPKQLRRLRTLNTMRSGVDFVGEPPSTESVMLLDLLPQFMTLCATRADGAPSPKMLNLLAEFMLQAVLDFVRLPFDEELSDAQIECFIEEAFAWGSSSLVNPEIDSTAALFWDYDNGSVLAKWTEIREEYLTELNPPRGNNDILGHLQRLCLDYPIKDFDSIMLKLIAQFAASVEQPLLVQLQGDKVTGLSEAETMQLKVKCGLPV